MTKIAAGIVLFNPDLECLRENINAISGQVNKIYIFNNGPDESLAQFGESDSIEVVYNKRGTNVGIAAALNRICESAFSAGYDWLFTLDQDSIVPPGLIAAYSRHIGDPSIGIICPRIYDRNFGYDSATENATSGYEYVDSCISSASLLRLDAWSKLGGFWDGLFIDMVDFDMCWSLRENGYAILKLNDVSLSHSLGNGKRVTFRGKPEIIYNHVPLRDYYVIRNCILVGRKHSMMNKCTRMALKRFVLISLFEESKVRKIHYMLMGFFDGIIGREGSMDILHS